MANMPQTRLQLFKLDNCDSTYTYVTNYINRTPDEYFDSISDKLIYEEIQYIRKNGIIDVPVIYDIVEDYNYCRYDNGEGRGWEYAFITEKSFVNFNMTRLDTQYDVWTNNLEKLKERRAGLSYNAIVSRLTENPSNINLINDLSISANICEDYSSLGIATIPILHFVLKKVNVGQEYPPYNFIQTFDIAVINDQTILSNIEKLIKSSYTLQATLIHMPLTYWDANKLPYVLEGIEEDDISGFKLIQYDAPTYSQVFSGNMFERITNVVGDIEEPKLFTYPYSKIEFKTATSEIEISPILLRNCVISYGATLDGNGVCGTYKIVDDIGGIHYISDRGVGISTVVSQYSDYVANNSNFNYQFMLSALQGSVSTGISTGIKSGGGSAGAIAGVASAVADFGIRSLDMHFKIDNLKRAPQNVVQIGCMPEVRQIMRQFGIIARYVKCDDETQDILKTYWRMFGYKYNKNIKIFKTIQTRRFCNYVQFDSFFMYVGCEEDRLKLKNIMENGVMIYHIDEDGLGIRYGYYPPNDYNYYVGEL